jgi:hypothetical protein
MARAIQEYLDNDKRMGFEIAPSGAIRA